MAIYHCSVKAISRSAGRSATAAAAYRSGSKIEDQRQAVVHDYTRKDGVMVTGIVVPEDAPAWAKNRADLWNQAEASEKRKNSTVAREVEVALPSELDAGQMRVLTENFSAVLSKRYAVGVDWAIHQPHRAGDDRNFHAHIMMTTRTLGPEGLGAKTRVLDDKLTGPAEVKWMREQWAEHVNRTLEKAGQAQRVDHRSLRAQELDRVPQIHAGPSVVGIERRAATRTEGPAKRGAVVAADLGKETETGKKLVAIWQANREAAVKLFEAEHPAKWYHRLPLVKGKRDKSRQAFVEAKLSEGAPEGHAESQKQAIQAQRDRAEVTKQQAETEKAQAKAQAELEAKRQFEAERKARIDAEMKAENERIRKIYAAKAQAELEAKQQAEAERKAPQAYEWEQLAAECEAEMKAYESSVESQDKPPEKPVEAARAPEVPSPTPAPVRAPEKPVEATRAPDRIDEIVAGRKAQAELEAQQKAQADLEAKRKADAQAELASYHEAVARRDKRRAELAAEAKRRAQEKPVEAARAPEVPSPTPAPVRAPEKPVELASYHEAVARRGEVRQRILQEAGPDERRRLEASYARIDELEAERIAPKVPSPMPAPVRAPEKPVEATRAPDRIDELVAGMQADAKATEAAEAKRRAQVEAKQQAERAKPVEDPAMAKKRALRAAAALGERYQSIWDNSSIGARGQAVGRVQTQIAAERKKVEAGDSPLSLVEFDKAVRRGKQRGIER